MGPAVPISLVLMPTPRKREVRWLALLENPSEWQEKATFSSRGRPCVVPLSEGVEEAGLLPGACRRWEAI